MKKAVRSASGVTVIAVVMEPYPCPHGRCVYCPASEGLPNAYISSSPAVMRAARLHFDPGKQVLARMNTLTEMGHRASKVEVIIIGGTFLHYPKDYREGFIKSVFDALNGAASATLEESQRKNEAAEHRCVALCIETRPELCTEENIRELLRLGVTRVELGVQCLDDSIYKLVNRGHSVNDVVIATKRLKDSCFKVGYHWMPGLPGSTPEHDIEMFEMLWNDERFKPDHLKIYPTQVVTGSLLDSWVKEGKFKPYDDESMMRLLVELKKRVPRYCRIMRVQRQISQEQLLNPIKGDIRVELARRMKAEGLRCRCIRCNEIGFNPNAAGLWSIHTTECKASGGKEWFVSYSNEDGVIIGVARLRLPAKPFLEYINSRTLLVRELHVYGSEVAVNDAVKGQCSVRQHRGVGKMLMMHAEQLAREQGCSKIAVISGVGVRDYYRKLGYELEWPLMTKAYLQH